VVSSNTKRPRLGSTNGFASCHNASVSKGCLRSRQVKASCAGECLPSGWHLAASVLVKTRWAAKRKWM